MQHDRDSHPGIDFRLGTVRHFRSAERNPGSATHYAYMRFRIACRSAGGPRAWMAVTAARLG
jgi:hypothetical protein